MLIHVIPRIDRGQMIRGQIIRLTAGPSPEPWPSSILCPECRQRVEIFWRREGSHLHLHDLPAEEPPFRVCLLSMTPVFKDYEFGQSKLV